MRRQASAAGEWQNAPGGLRGDGEGCQRAGVGGRQCVHCAMAGQECRPWAKSILMPGRRQAAGCPCWWVALQWRTRPDRMPKQTVQRFVIGITFAAGRMRRPREDDAEQQPGRVPPAGITNWPATISILNFCRCPEKAVAHLVFNYYYSAAKMAALPARRRAAGRERRHASLSREERRCLDHRVDVNR